MSMSKTAKSTSYASNRNTSDVSKSRENAAFLKMRVQELEAEVISLKKRLDDLRKAKNTTVLKKEKEYVSIGASDASRSKRQPIPDEKSTDLQKKLKDLSLQHAGEIEALKKKHDTDLMKAKTQKPGTPPEKCNHEEEIKQLREDVSILRDENANLARVNSDYQAENVALHEKFEELFNELSLKEAQWCEKEEQLNLKLKLQWGEKYREWMEATEKKIEELQRANDYLRTCLKSPGD
ncbi:uncharacterized protein [Diadema setosum]|uniref:uncharacterized protein n=1 Tax=Diadema setosum TaxID=31175 RepID=UPI003B3AB0A8